MMLTALSAAPVLAQDTVQKMPAFNILSTTISTDHYMLNGQTHKDKFTAITAQMDIESKCIGPYNIHVELLSVEDKHITSQPYFEYASSVNDPSLMLMTDAENEQHSIKFRFSGEAIRRKGIDGPYKIKVYNWPFPELKCADSIQPDPTYWFNTPPYNAEDFGEYCGSGESARPCEDVYE
ncbi:MAG: hypothetical protein VX740_06645 [Pseudomonadota bacterium]|nr:hypothetical protein [Pseudomonadota bacterium]